MKTKHKLKKEIIFIGAILLGLLLSFVSINAYKESLKVPGAELIVDGTSWFIVSDRVALEAVLEEYKTQYTTGITENAANVVIQFNQDVVIKDVRVEKEKLVSLEEAKTKITEIETPADVYTVVRGDSVWAIAQTHGIEMADIIKYNPDLDPEKIYAGSRIVFLPADPGLDVEIRFNSTTIEPVQFDNEYIKDSSILSGQRVVVKQGIEGSKQVTYDITLRNGYERSTEVLNELELKAPVGGVVRVGTMTTLHKKSSNDFGVVIGHLSSGFGWRIDPISGKRTYHTGIDIAANYGASVYAYTNGTILEAGFNVTKGNYVTIKHSGGITTSYLHLSKILVKKGQTVKVGQKIGQVGSTGYSTGNHLHFMVTKNGVNINPWNYL